MRAIHTCNTLGEAIYCMMTRSALPADLTQKIEQFLATADTSVSSDSSIEVVSRCKEPRRAPKPVSKPERAGSSGRVPASVHAPKPLKLKSSSSSSSGTTPSAHRTRPPAPPTLSSSRSTVSKSLASTKDQTELEDCEGKPSYQFENEIALMCLFRYRRSPSCIHPSTDHAAFQT